MRRMHWLSKLALGMIAIAFVLVLVSVYVDGNTDYGKRIQRIKDAKRVLPGSEVELDLQTKSVSPYGYHTLLDLQAELRPRGQDGQAVTIEPLSDKPWPAVIEVKTTLINGVPTATSRQTIKPSVRVAVPDRPDLVGSFVILDVDGSIFYPSVTWSEAVGGGDGVFEEKRADLSQRVELYFVADESELENPDDIVEVIGGLFCFLTMGVGAIALIRIWLAWPEPVTAASGQRVVQQRDDS